MQLVYWGLVFNLTLCCTLKGMDENQLGNLSILPMEILYMIIECVPDDNAKSIEVARSLVPWSKTCRLGRYMAKRICLAGDMQDMPDPFGFAIRSGDMELFNNLLYFNYGDIKKKPDDIQSRFFTAVIFEKPKMIDALIDLGAQVNALNHKRRTSLFYALERGCFRSFESLLAHKADINQGAIIDGSYMTPLQLAQLIKETIVDDPMRAVEAPCKEKYEKAIVRLQSLGAQE